MIPIIIILLLCLLVLYFMYSEIKTNKKPFDNLVQKLFLRIDSIFKSSPSDTGWSSNRIIFVISNILADTIIWGGVLTLFMVTDKFPDIPEGLLWLYALAKGLTAASKLAQKPLDNKLSEILTQAQPQSTETSDTNSNSKKEPLYG